jgi:hypothetical protein
MGADRHVPSLSAFYGVLGLLSETDLSEEQGELGKLKFTMFDNDLTRCSVDTAKLSCELLLEVIRLLESLLLGIHG